MKKILTIITLVAGLLIGCEVSVQNAEEVITSDSEMNWETVKSFARMDRNAYGREQLFTEQSQSRLNKAQPPIMLEWSLEREQLNERNSRWNDPNKISYIYLLSDVGTVVAYFPIKGKVSSVNSMLTTTNQVVVDWNGNSGTVESPNMDGSYGTNGDGIFFFLTDGTYMEWAGKYLLSDQPIKLSVEPIMTYNTN